MPFSTSLSQPKKTRSLEKTAVFTTTSFDLAGRVTTVTTPDNAVVITNYIGTTVTVTDQAGKQRRSVTDALGRLIKVYEAPNDPSHNYLTSYNYDVLDNLTTVTQGNQTPRSFAYDSLKRLISAINPESGSVTYQYDNNGNLTRKTDARSIHINYGYDALNRTTTVDYSNTATINSDITRAYDGATNGKGRFWFSYAGGNFSAGSNVEHTAVDSYDALGRPLVQRQLFKLNNIWGLPYQSGRSYNLAGGVTSETYPSGRTVSYSYDSAGRTSSFSGNLGGVPRTYSTGIIYSPFGGMTKEQFGTATPIYNQSSYNSRGQLAEIRAGTSITSAPELSWNRGKFVNWYSAQCGGALCNNTDNNGNLRKQETLIPHNDSVTSSTSWSQQFDYDGLNRLERVKEFNSVSNQLWQQEYVYDRWGNRTIHQTNTWGPTSGPLIPEPNFGVDPANNNRLTAPAGYTMTYDVAGNLTTDTFSGAVTRAYDAENRMISETRAGGNVAGRYTYNADGQRVRREANNEETWQVYGMDGELLAEYAANGGTASPQKEYGYRNGQLLITAQPASGGGSNQSPVANAGGPYSGTAGTAIQFNGSASDPEG